MFLNFRRSVIYGSLLLSLLNSPVAAFSPEKFEYDAPACVETDIPFLQTPIRGNEKNLAVLLIDMQDYHYPLADHKELGEKATYQLEVLRYSRDHQIPVVVTEYKCAGETSGIFKQELDQFPEGKVYYLEKEGNDSFGNNDLKDLLWNAGIEHLLLMGIFTTFCVQTTAASARENGFNVLTSRNLMTDKKHVPPDEETWWFKQKGVYFEDYKDLLKLLDEGKEIPRNKFY